MAKGRRGATLKSRIPDVQSRNRIELTFGAHHITKLASTVTVWHSIHIDGWAMYSHASSRMKHIE
jgi:hypothetical protein